jgi:hypothetical protein
MDGIEDLKSRPLLWHGSRGAWKFFATLSFKKAWDRGFEVRQE